MIILLVILFNCGFILISPFQKFRVKFKDGFAI